MINLYQNEVDNAILSYVFESASFEYDNGNMDFAVFLEADTDQGDTAPQQTTSPNEGWFAKLKRTTVTFIRSAMQAARAMINKIGNNRRIKKASKAMADAINKEGREANRTITLTPEQNTRLSNMETLAAIDNFTNIIATSLETARTKAQGDTSWNEEFKAAFNEKVNPNSNKSVPAKIGLNMVQRFLQNSINMMASLNTAFNSVNTILNRIKNGGYSRSQIRLAISYAYNYMTRVVREYYNTAMDVAKSFSN